MRKVDEAALDRAVQATGEPKSLMRVAIQAYLDGLQAARLQNNHRIAKLASMAVGDRIYGHPLGHQGRRTYLQTKDIERARVLMNNPKAQWRVTFTPGRVGTAVERIA